MNVRPLRYKEQLFMIDSISGVCLEAKLLVQVQCKETFLQFRGSLFYNEVTRRPRGRSK